jgi:hypothetical protein
MPNEQGSGADTSAYKPNTNVRRPGGSPEYAPTYRVLVHRKHEDRWLSLADHIPLAQAQQFYDHVSQTPGKPAERVHLTCLRGKAGEAKDGWSRVFHWRVPGSATRLDYVYRDDYVGIRGDPHPVVQIRAINFSSHRGAHRGEHVAGQLHLRLRRDGFRVPVHAIRYLLLHRGCRAGLCDPERAMLRPPDGTSRPPARGRDAEHFWVLTPEPGATNLATYAISSCPAYGPRPHRQAAPQRAARSIASASAMPAPSP